VNSSAVISIDARIALCLNPTKTPQYGKTPTGQIAFGICGSQATVVIFSALLMLSISPAQAATRYWDGGNADIAANGDGNSEDDHGSWKTSRL